MSTLNTYNLKSPDSANTNLALDASGNVAIQAGSASTPSVYVTGDANTGLYSPGADQIAVATGGTARLYIDASGRVGIGTTGPTAIVHANSGSASDVYFRSSNSLATSSLGTAADGSTYVYNSAAYPITFSTNATERARIDSSGRLLVGTSSARNVFFNFPGLTPGLQIEGTSFQNRNISIISSDNSVFNADSGIILARQKSGSIGGNTLVSDGDALGLLSFQGSDGADFVEGARIEAFVDGTPGANDMPGRLVFSTTADGASSPTERMRIANDGAVVIGKTSVDDTTAGFAWRASQYFSAVRSGGAPGYINRLTNDGTLLEFAQDSTTEGTISVSGTTVSYNGAHLSRWSQLPSGQERTEILRGSVLSNIDEMCEWTDEDNEQLNRMKVSDVVGDKNVSGVFQAWDDDDSTYVNDFYCAMTGDFIIRIGAGVTVERGDLLMSAGDGTAKPQDDDIIRSKTIAKVTSTNVSCTYDDGSYCVPCVLMAC
jgi:hypothetical protein